jgi:hypothetical protein
MDPALVLAFFLGVAIGTLFGIQKPSERRRIPECEKCGGRIERQSGPVPDLYQCRGCCKIYRPGRSPHSSRVLYEE